MILKELLVQKPIVKIFGIGRIPHHNLIQQIGMHGGFDAVWFDMEHVGLSTETLEVGTIAARSTGMDSFCRVAPTDYATVTRCLEAGSGGIMAAQIFTAAQAEAFVSWCKFAPEGQRGVNTGGYDGGFATLTIPAFIEKANRESFVAIQIETTSAVEECEDIAAIKHVDLLFIGPSDLSQALGVPGQFFHPKCIEALKRVNNACRSQHKHWGAVAANPDHAKLLLELGCKMISPSSDVKLINQGLLAMKQSFGSVFG